MSVNLQRRIGVFAAIAVSLANLVYVLGYATPAAARAIVDASNVSIDRATGRRLYEGQPFTGEARAYHGDGSLAKVEQFVEGRRSGYLKVWFPNGQTAFESAYIDGRRQGQTTSWWSNGNKRSETYFVDDQPDGIAWSWYRTGEKYKRYSYAAGVPVGLQQGWRQNGKLFSNFEYRNGRAYGLRNSNLCVELEDEELFKD